MSNVNVIEEQVLAQEERQCGCCGSYDGDPYAILSNEYCIPCDLDARISCGLTTQADELLFFKDFVRQGL